MRRIFVFPLFQGAAQRVGDSLHRLAREYGCIGRLSTVAHRLLRHRAGNVLLKPSNACWVCIGFG